MIVDSDRDSCEDEDFPLAELAHAETIYGQKLIDLVHAEVETYDRENVDWDRPATELLMRTVQRPSPKVMLLRLWTGKK